MPEVLFAQLLFAVFSKAQDHLRDPMREQYAFDDKRHKTVESQMTLSQAVCQRKQKIGSVLYA